MDQEIRNKLRNVVTQCRKLLAGDEQNLEKDKGEIRELLEGRYGIFATKDQVTADPNAKMTHLTEEEQAARKDILDHFAHISARGLKPKEALDQLVREIAFTHLNRLCAYKMMEARDVYVGGQKFREAVSRGVHSNGVKFYLADHPDELRLFETGHQDVAYRHFLDWLGGALSDEIGVLFNPNDPANRLYPRQKTIDEVLDLLNGGGIKPEETVLREQWPLIWSQDETIGWVYQYFTPKEMRDKARKESRSPRNSNELAFRNQFFTPRYVVEFLTDNSLGRIWYEMREGETKLKDQCRYMVRRPTEMFLNEGEQPPKDAAEGKDEFSQEELLKLPVHIPHRPKKDPRELKILDPACGSGHFLLYCFDLLLTIYEEAYADPDLGPALQKDYPKLEDLQRDVPRLILAHNLHGIDIDLRASQIASLALWLRCQRAYQDMGLKKDRPKITRSNFVCAEPMPGEAQMRREFVSQLEPKVLGQVVEVIFDKMKLAGEAGSLLKIEGEILGTIREAKRQYDMGGIPLQQTLFDKPVEPGKKRFSVQDLPNDEFFERAESRVVEALRTYAEGAGNGHRLQRRLFAEDAAQGFSFIELCHRRFDVILMNPPFGELSKNSKSYIETNYENSYNDILAAFVERTLELCVPNGFVGAITNRNCFYLTTMTSYRKEVLQRRVGFEALLDLGEGVLDATVEAAIYILRHLPRPQQLAPFIRLLIDEDKANRAIAEVVAANSGTLTSRAFYSAPVDFARLESAPFCYWVRTGTLRTLSAHPKLEGNVGTVRVGLQTSKDPRFLRLIWEVQPALITPSPSISKCSLESLQNECLKELNSGKRWAFYSKTDEARPWLSPLTLVVDWENSGQRIKDYARQQGDSPSRSVRSEDRYFQAGFSYMLRSTRLVPYIIPPGVIPTAGRSQVYPEPKKEIEVLGICASRLGSAVARFGGEYFARPKFQNSMVQSIPAVPVSARTRKALEERFNSELSQKRNVLSHFEPWHEFVLPAILDNLQLDDAWQLDSLIGKDLEEQIATDAGLSKEDLTILCRDLDDAISIRTKSTTAEDEDEDAAEDGDEESADGDDKSISLVDLSPRAQYEGLLSYCLGVVFGRWDVRLAQNRSLIPRSQDVLDPLPVVPPGTLVSPNGYPATTGNIVSEAWLKARPNAVYMPATGSVSQPTIPDAKYPVAVQWDGVLVDSADEHGRPTSPSDIEGRIQAVLEVIFGKQAAAQEKAACEVLGVKSLREYLRKPGNGGFWLDHVARYTKSRRKAPIYWLLQSKNKSFGLWVYYHRLDRDLLFKALQSSGPVQTKINLEKGKLDELYRRKKEVGDSGKEAKKVATAVSEQEDLLSELKEFAEKLEKAANLNFGDKTKLDSGVRYDPDLNDGVVLNIAPLHELVPWKEAKKYWLELMAGKHEWSSIGKQLRQKGLVK
jgi:hypothetical protein